MASRSSPAVTPLRGTVFKMVPGAAESKLTKLLVVVNPVTTTA